MLIAHGRASILLRKIDALWAQLLLGDAAVCQLAGSAWERGEVVLCAWRIHSIIEVLVFLTFLKVFFAAGILQQFSIHVLGWHLYIADHGAPDETVAY